jgi:hypothetical protein
MHDQPRARATLWFNITVDLASRIKERDPEYMPKPEWLSTLVFVFPEIGKSVRRVLDSSLKR